MLAERLAFALVMFPAAAWVLAQGGTVYLAAIIGTFVTAALEYANLFQVSGLRPARPLLVVGVAVFILSGAYPVLNPHGLLFAAGLILALTWHLIDYERGAPQSATDFVVTVAGLFYLGWVGVYFITLRALPDGQWWLFTILPTVWLADTGAFIFWRLFGRHKLAPRLSPKKTWEGYCGGILGGALGGAVLTILWSLYLPPDTTLTWPMGLLAGALSGLVGPVGDLGISMFKRQVGVKDSSALLAGHGGALDRIDSWLVAVPVGYFLALWFTSRP